MKKIIPFNTIGGGNISPTITAHYHKAGYSDFYPDNKLVPHIAILEVEMKEPRIIQIGSYSPSSSCNAKVLDVDGICPTLLDHKGAEPAVVMPVSCAMRGRNPRNPSDRQAGIDTEQRLEIGGDVANCITSVQKDSLLAEPIRIKQATAQGYVECPIGGVFDASYPTTKTRRGRVQDNGEIVGAITSSADGHCLYEGAEVENDEMEIRYRIRKLTPRECFRLMDVDDADIDRIEAYRVKTTAKDGIEKEKSIPKTQRYKLAGNSIVVSCLYHIFYQMFIAEPPKPEPRQLSFDFGE